MEKLNCKNKLALISFLFLTASCSGTKILTADKVKGNYELKEDGQTKSALSLNDDFSFTFTEDENNQTKEIKGYYTISKKSVILKSDDLSSSERWTFKNKKLQNPNSKEGDYYRKTK